MWCFIWRVSPLVVRLFREEADVVTLLKIAIEDPKDDYVILKEPEGLGGGTGRGDDGYCSLPSPSSSSRSCSSFGGGFWCFLWWWSKLVLVFIFLPVVGVCFFLWIGPFLMNKACRSAFIRISLFYLQIPLFFLPLMHKSLINPNFLTFLKVTLTRLSRKNPNSQS